MKNPIVDLVAILLLLIVVLVGGFMYAKNRDKPKQVLELPPTEIKAKSGLDEPVKGGLTDKPKWDTDSFEHKVKRTE